MMSSVYQFRKFASYTKPYYWTYRHSDPISATHVYDQSNQDPTLDGSLKSNLFSFERVEFVLTNGLQLNSDN